MVQADTPMRGDKANVVDGSSSVLKYVGVTIAAVLILVYFMPGETRQTEHRKSDTNAMFAFNEEAIRGGKKFFVEQSGNPVTYGGFLSLLVSDKDFMKEFLVNI